MKRLLVIAALLLLIICLWVLRNERGGLEPVAHWFDNMSVQAVARDSQSHSLGDGLAQGRAPVRGTVAAAAGALSGGLASRGGVESNIIFPRTSGSYLTTGRQAGGFGNSLPVELGGLGGYAKLAVPGEEVYARHCVVCHGLLGDGQGIMADYPEYPVMRSLADDRFVRYPLGRLYQSVARGQGHMPAFGQRLTTSDIWAVCSHIRLLQNRERRAGR